MPEDLVGILEALSAGHRAYLLDENAGRLIEKRPNKKQPKLKTVAQRLARLGEVLGVDGILPYKFAYMRRSARFVHLYKMRDARNAAAASGVQIKAAIARHYPKWKTGVEPGVAFGDHPKFNLVQDLPDGSFLVDLVARDKTRTVPSGYGFTLAEPISHDWLLVRATPPIFEINARTVEHRNEITAELAASADLDPEGFHLFSFDRPAQWQTLAETLEATIGGHQGNGRDHKEPAAYYMSARLGESLDDIDQWKAQNVDHTKARELRFDFVFTFADGFEEQTCYYLNNVTGQIKFPVSISEQARNRVCDEYIAIVAA